MSFFLCSVTYLIDIYLLVQPPPAITDKQLDEREHTVEEWKGISIVLCVLFIMACLFL